MKNHKLDCAEGGTYVLKEQVADGTLSGILGVGGAGELLAEILPRLGGAGLEQDDRVTLGGVGN